MSTEYLRRGPAAAAGDVVGWLRSLAARPGLYVGSDPATGRVDYWHVVHLLNGWQLAALVEPGLQAVPLTRADGTHFGTWLAAELGVRWGPELAWGHLPLATLPGLARDAYGRPVLAPTEHAAALELLGELLLRFQQADDS